MAILQSKHSQFVFNHIISYVQMVHTHTANQWVDIFINNKKLHYFVDFIFFTTSMSLLVNSELPNTIPPCTQHIAVSS